MSIDFQKIRELLGAIAQTDITEFSLKGEAFELTVKKGQSPGVPMASLPVPITTPAPTPLTAPAPVVDTPPPAVDPKWVDITSPMVGTFYRAPAPTEPPFVETGDRINNGQTVCIIEAMKLMNEIEAEINGQIMEILVQNGEPVEFGQPLMRINPS
ncbi:acetyl-CoA carboxylase biotin carboxyl carrier protein [Spirulina sp. CCNP1310]|uniref:acetyl-CoA carboxylase biotin carboxyl carrier protein n=1 Tax=Spirulina sp. CCNP1310 TaxID=3110249 RepID=UPI002B1FE60A|nr:acetyl-CoA carboxylase biotin carboxyl carrier protein [Spirulina sp. CCNP1310]MEA5417592.1 acetyl-CoA carboxylase biotin carboxyl carrier protein [Spirulina sp. CCNP1310]